MLDIPPGMFALPSPLMNVAFSYTTIKDQLQLLESVNAPDDPIVALFRAKLEQNQNIVLSRIFHLCENHFATRALNFAKNTKTTLQGIADDDRDKLISDVCARGTPSVIDTLISLGLTSKMVQTPTRAASNRAWNRIHRDRRMQTVHNTWHRGCLLPMPDVAQEDFQVPPMIVARAFNKWAVANHLAEKLSIPPVTADMQWDSGSHKYRPRLPFEEKLPPSPGGIVQAPGGHVRITIPRHGDFHPSYYYPSSLYHRYIDSERADVLSHPKPGNAGRAKALEKKLRGQHRSLSKERQKRAQRDAARRAQQKRR